MSCKTLFFSPMYYWLLQIQISTWILRNSTKNLWWKVKSSTNLSWIATGSLSIQCTQKSQTRPSKSKMLIKLPNYHIYCVLFCFCLKSSPRKALDCVYKYRFLRECSVNKRYQHVQKKKKIVPISLLRFPICSFIKSIFSFMFLNIVLTTILTPCLLISVCGSSLSWCSLISFSLESWSQF